MFGTENYTLIRGDCLDRSLIAPESAHLIVTSPPYNLGKEYDGTEAGDNLQYKEYLEFTSQWLENCYEWAAHTGRICINVGIDTGKGGRRPTGADITTAAMNAGWKYHATIIWNKSISNSGTAWGSYQSPSAPCVNAPVELIIVLYKGEWKLDRKGVIDITGDEFKDWVGGFWTMHGASTMKGHPAPFPPELPKRCIKLFSYERDVVLDPFLGSGTTMVEAMNLGRIAVGVEKEEAFCRMAERRIAKETAVALSGALF